VSNLDDSGLVGNNTALTTDYYSSWGRLWLWCASAVSNLDDSGFVSNNAALANMEINVAHNL
jgi:hypothetical protein